MEEMQCCKRLGEIIKRETFMEKGFASFRTIEGLHWERFCREFQVSVGNDGGKVSVTVSGEGFVVSNIFPDDRFSSRGLVPFGILGRVRDVLFRVHMFIWDRMSGNVSGSAEECMFRMVSAKRDGCSFSKGVITVPLRGGSLKVSRVSRLMLRDDGGNLTIPDKFYIDDADISVELDGARPVQVLEDVQEIMEEMNRLASDIVSV